jgi:uncharacterized membrane protein
MDREAPNSTLKKLANFLASTLVTGVVIAIPVYLAGLLLFKAAKSLSALVRPIAKLVPDWLPVEGLISWLLVLFVCFLVGLTFRIPAGRAAWGRLQTSLFHKIPGYDLIRSLAQRLAGESQDQAWKPALAEIEEALVPAFIIEEHEDGCFTVFVPSVPTPLAGAVYILTPDRVHPLNVPFTHVLKAVSRWGSGTKDLAAAMQGKKPPSSEAIRDDVRKVG